MIFNKRLYDLRKYRNLTQQQLAEKMNVNQRTISNWESDISEPNMQQLRKLSRILNCSYQYLVGADVATTRLIPLMREILLKKVELNQDDQKTFDTKLALEKIKSNDPLTQLEGEFELDQLATAIIVEKTETILPEEEYAKQRIANEIQLKTWIDNPPYFDS